MGIPLRAMVLVVAVLSVTLATAAPHKEGDPADMVGTLKINEAGFIGGEGCNITVTDETSKEVIGLMAARDSSEAKQLEGMKDQRARVRGVWKLHKGVEVSDFWYVEVTSVKNAPEPQKK